VRTAKYYVNLGASKHLIPSKVYLRSYREFDKPVKISVANDGQILAYGSGHLWVATLVNGQEREVDLEDVYYAPRVHIRLLSMRKLRTRGGMSVFARVAWNFRSAMVDCLLILRSRTRCTWLSCG